MLARDTWGEASPATIHNSIGVKEGLIVLRLVTPVLGVWMQFEAEFLPENYIEQGPKPVTLPLCDYASAGNGSSR